MTREELKQKCFETQPSALVDVKADWLEKLLPCEGLIDTGGVWGCNGFYSLLAAERGAYDVLMVDTLGTEIFKELRRKHPLGQVIHSVRDFSKDVAPLQGFGTIDAWIAYDVLLHQLEPLGIIDRFFKTFPIQKAVFANPVLLRDSPTVELCPGNPRFQQFSKHLRPSKKPGDHSGWVWLFTHSYLLQACEYLGLEVVEEEMRPDWGWPGSGLGYSLIRVERRNP